MEPQLITISNRIASLQEIVELPDSRQLQNEKIVTLAAEILQEAVLSDQKDLDVLVKKIDDPKISKLYREEMYCKELNEGTTIFTPSERTINRYVKFPLFVRYDPFADDFTIEYHNYLAEAKEGFSVVKLDRNAVLEKIQGVKERLQTEFVARVEEIAGKENVRGPLEVGEIDSWENFKDLYKIEDFRTEDKYIVTYPATGYANEMLLMHCLKKEGVVSFPVPMVALEYSVLLAKSPEF